MELQSAVRERAKVTVVVFSEGSWSMEVPNEQMRYGKTFGTEMGPIRWDKIAEGVGCAGFFVDAMSDLEPALNQARSTAEPALICVRTDRTANMSVPMSVGQRFGEVYSGPVA
jgi:thiamine pyrophosphate-dependent acetolactate synthase large subunit-like protein